MKTAITSQERSLNFGTLLGGQSGTVTACYAGGMTYTTELRANGRGTINYSYYEAASSSDDADAAVQAKTKDALRGPTDYSGIYEDWNDLDADDSTDTETFWDFGTSSQYPVLKGIDVNLDGNIDA